MAFFAKKEVQKSKNEKREEKDALADAFSSSHRLNACLFPVKAINIMAWTVEIVTSRLKDIV